MWVKCAQEFEATNELWDKALKLFRENHDQVAEAEMVRTVVQAARGRIWEHSPTTSFVLMCAALNAL